MGRAGRGSGGGGSSGGGHSRSRSSGGHLVGGSSRAGRGYSSSHSYGGSHHHYHSHSHHGGSYSTASYVVTFLVIIIVLIVESIINQPKTTKSTIQRTKLDTGYAYINDCVIDEIGWVEDEIRLEKGLKKFWNKTGVQPFIILKAYDSSLVTESDKEKWTTNYYDKNFDNENIFLYVYFCEENENDVGYMTYANGYKISSVMDSEAVEIFWNYVDRYWYEDIDTDDMFINIFTSTGTTIMKVSKTGKDIAFIFIAFLIVVVVGIFLLRALLMKFKRDKEKAEERQRILETPVNTMSSNSDLENKYLKE